MNDFSNLALQNRLLSEEVKRRVDQLAAINTVAATVSQTLDLNHTLNVALEIVLGIVKAEAGGISLIDEKTGEVVMRAQLGWEQDFTHQSPMRVPINMGMSGEVISNNSVVIYNDLKAADKLAVPRFRQERFQAIAMAPMHARNKIVGILSIMSSQPNSFDDEVVGVLEAIADTVGVALDNARLYETTVEEQNSLSAILDSTADGIIATNQKGRIRLINNAAEIMFGLNSKALIGTPLREIPIDVRIREALLHSLSRRAHETRESFEMTLSGERTLSVTVSPVIVEKQIEQHNLTDGWVIVFQDVTHLRESELARAQFIMAAAHDMRSPLGVTLSSLNLLERRIQSDDPKVEEVIRLAMSGVNRLQAIIDDLMNIEQIESGYGLRMDYVDLNELIRETGEQVKPMMIEKGLIFTIEIQSSLPHYYTDRNLISRALMNYLENAVKYNDPGNQISLTAFIKEAAVHFEVGDNGRGIPTEAQPRLFERFYRVARTEHIPGTGLGLAIVKTVAQKHNGSVYVRSRDGQGSTFGLALPLDNAVPAEA